MTDRGAIADVSERGGSGLPGRSSTGPTFEGRSSEIDQLTRGLDDAIGGRSRVFLLMGEPGIGKTRLCDELTALASKRDVPVLWGAPGRRAGRRRTGRGWMSSAG